MNPDRALIDLLDRYAKNALPPDEKAALEQRMEGDPVLSQQVQEHLNLIESMRFYGRRHDLKASLDEIHDTMTTSVQHEQRPPVMTVTRTNLWRKYWPMTAVAASVALISILGTLQMTQSLETKQTAYYKELRRNVEQIRKSQSRLMADIAESNKEKTGPVPETYAGTGFMISANGYVATSYHVIKGADSVYIENETFGRLKVDILFSDKENDISILKIAPELLTPVRSLPYTVSPSEANLGEEVFTLGFPREDIVFGEGSVSAATGYKQNPNAYQVSVPVNPGNSGGPLFNAKGELVGIISGLQTETSGAAFATKSTILLHAIMDMPIDTVNVPLALPRINTLKNLGKVQQVKKWREYVFMVRVYNAAK
ncbi:S1C family serine protease [Fulvivirgaceae bacterium PWU5]|uniref:S1C family serine protease n=1 Tax=Dawidia cretensis TaxID=2782350 RepID=A0AAP2GR98_9BACT|nr:serine protease [Dawidia cretensis]MBT1710531.1 S1C family serine protease [Dawidia cretensis]